MAKATRVVPYSYYICSNIRGQPGELCRDEASSVRCFYYYKNNKTNYAPALTYAAAFFAGYLVARALLESSRVYIYSGREVL